MCNLLSFIVLSISAVALLPTTGIYFSGLAISVLGIFSANEGVTPAFLYLSIFLLIPGYGLACLWWLVYKFRVITIAQLPMYIWSGLFICVVSGVLMVTPSIRRGFDLSTPSISIADLLKTKYYIGCAPIIVLLVLLLFMAIKKAHCRNSIESPR